MCCLIICFMLFFLSLDATMKTYGSPTTIQRFRDNSGFLLSLNRQALNFKSLNTSQIIFNPDPIKQEIKSLFVKYKNANAFLKLKDDLSKIVLPEIYATRLHSSGVHLSETPLFPPILGNPGKAKIPLKDLIIDSYDILYYGTVAIGTPPQHLTVDIDTGSADLWVPADCSSCTNQQFHKEASSTYSSNDTIFQVAYGSGEVSAILSADVVSVPGLSINNQQFGAVISESRDFNNFPNSGILGLAFSSIAASGQPTFTENLIMEQRLAAPLFSVHLERGKETGSEICIGCINSDKTIGDVHWVPVISKSYWTISLDGIWVNTTAAPATNVVAAIDTGTSLIYLPEDLASRFYNMIPGSRLAPEYGPEFYAYPCGNVFTISFSFGSHNFVINNGDFNMGPIQSDSPECIGGILSLGADFPAELAIIGDEFMKSWYATFDYANGARIGFSPSINNRA